MKKKLSIIIPVYNTEDYLEECLNSVINQTYKNIEILIMDDGSTDNSLKILKKYEKKFPDMIKVFTQKNKGQGNARNNLLDIATGYYIAFVDSDDYTDPTMYEEMITLAESENYDLVICDSIDHYEKYDVYHHLSDFDEPLLKSPAPWNKLIKKSLIKDLRYPEIWYEDFAFISKIVMNAKKIGRINKAFYHCHCRTVSTMNNNNSLKNLDIIEAFKIIKNYVKDNKLEKKYSEVLEYLAIEHILLTSINRVAKQKNKDKNYVIKKLRNYIKDNYPNWKENKIYKSKSFSIRLICTFNYHKLHVLSRFILYISSVLKNRK